MPKFIVELTNEEYESLQERANEKYGHEADEDFNPMDYSGGNFDDCYDIGFSHADSETAREILNILGNPV